MSIQLDYDTCKHIAIDFLRQCRSDLDADNDLIAAELNAGLAKEVQLRDYVDNVNAIEDINAVLHFLGHRDENLPE